MQVKLINGVSLRLSASQGLQNLAVTDLPTRATGCGMPQRLRHGLKVRRALLYCFQMLFFYRVHGSAR